MALKAQGAPIIGVAYKDEAAKSRVFLKDTWRPLYHDAYGHIGSRGS